MKPVFKEYDQGEQILFPANLGSKIPQNSPVRTVSQIVDYLNIDELLATYEGGGTSAYHPRMMLKVVLFAYLSNIYSCRKIEDAIKDSISFMWLTGGLSPDHNTINRFRSKRLKNTIDKIFTQVVLMLVDMGYLSLDIEYVDGTKMESRANRYTFVWRKTVERNKAKLEENIRKVLGYIEEGITPENPPEGEPPVSMNSEELEKRVAEINRENRTKEENQAIKMLEKKYLPKLQEYENHLEILGNRNSYSKTDESATFMRMKDDHMQNGQLKPAYNLQISTESQFITHFGLFPNPADFLTFKPFMNGYEKRYQKMPAKCVADSGYGSEENYNFMKSANIEPFVKFPYFHKEQKQSFKNNAFHSQNLYYNAKEDYLVCPMGQHMTKVGTGTRTSESGFVSNVTFYEAKNCSSCPLICLCSKTKENRKIEINHNLNSHKNKARELLTSEEGMYHRSQRPIEPEAVFGQGKSNKAYNRFRHFGKDLILMDYAIFATAFNLGKLCNKRQAMSKNGQNPPFCSQPACLLVFFVKKYQTDDCSDIFPVAQCKIAA